MPKQFLGDFSYYNINNLSNEIDIVCNVAASTLADNNLYPLEQYTPVEFLPTQCFARIYYNSILTQINGINISSNDLEIKENEIGWAIEVAICNKTNCK